MHGGASGAIWALMTATIIYKIENREDYSDIIRCFIFNLIFTFSVTGISWQGHIGGGLFGLMVMYGMLKCKEVHWWGGEL